MHLFVAAALVSKPLTDRICPEEIELPRERRRVGDDAISEVENGSVPSPSSVRAGCGLGVMDGVHEESMPLPLW
jgi:hypothetical protein